MLKTGEQGLAHVATDRSMTAALASQDPLTVGASARIVAHTLTRQAAAYWGGRELVFQEAPHRANRAALEYLQAWAGITRTG